MFFCIYQINTVLMIIRDSIENLTDLKLLNSSVFIISIIKLLSNTFFYGLVSQLHI